MVTPIREEIRRLAQQKERENNPSLPSVTSEDYEMRNNGTWMQSRNELMTDKNRSEHLAYLENEALDIGYRLIEKGRFASGQKPKPTVNPFAFDWVEAEKSNILISGTNSTGKSRLAAKLANILKTVGWQVIAFDNSGVWREISDIPIYIQIDEDEGFYEIPLVEDESVIYDISQLIPEQQKQFVDYVLLDLWNNRDNDNINWVMVALEEFQLYGRTTRGNIAQNLFRIMHAGRNKQVRVLAVTTDLALIDASFIRLCGLRYHARLNIEANSKRRFKTYYGREWLEIANSLPLGQFIYLNKNKLQQINVPLFEAKTKPQDYNDYLQSLQPQPKPKAKGFWARLLGA